VFSVKPLPQTILVTVGVIVLVGVIVGVGVGVGLDGAHTPIGVTVKNAVKPGMTAGTKAEQTVTLPRGGMVGNVFKSQSNPNGVMEKSAEVLVNW